MKDIVEQLKEHLASITKEQFQAEWAEIEAMDIRSPNALDYIHSVMNYQTSQATDVEVEKFAADFKEIVNHKNGYHTKKIPTKRKTKPKITLSIQFFDGELDLLVPTV